MKNKSLAVLFGIFALLLTTFNAQAGLSSVTVIQEYDETLVTYTGFWEKRENTVANDGSWYALGNSLKNDFPSPAGNMSVDLSSADSDRMYNIKIGIVRSMYSRYDNVKVIIKTIHGDFERYHSQIGSMILEKHVIDLGGFVGVTGIEISNFANWRHVAIDYIEIENMGPAYCTP